MSELIREEWMPDGSIRETISGGDLSLSTEFRLRWILGEREHCASQRMSWLALSLAGFDLAPEVWRQLEKTRRRQAGFYDAC